MMEQEINPDVDISKLGFSVYEDSPSQRINRYSGEKVREVHCGTDAKALICREPFTGDNFRLVRELSRDDAELLDWSLEVKSVISKETKSNLLEVIRNNSHLNPAWIHRKLYNNIPRYEISKNSDLDIYVAEDRKIPPIEEIGTESAIKSDEESDYRVEDLPTDSFFEIKGLSGVGNFIPQAEIRILREDLPDIKDRITECVQNGQFSESRLRSLIDISFDLKRRDDTEEIV